MDKIGIIGAMEEEVTVLAAQLKDAEVSEEAGCKFYDGMLEGVPVVLMQSGIGKVNAAVGTTLLIHRFQPDFLINSGVAGGFDHTMKVGDLVLSTEVRYNDVDATVFGYAFGQVPAMPESYMADAGLRRTLARLGKSLNTGIREGLILSGDSFMNDEDRIASLKESFPDALCAEMEAGAIAQVCYRYGLPFVVVRALSDIAGGSALTSYETFMEETAERSARFVQQFVAAYRQ